jgi:NADH-quinone oxidoreductase subunit M
MGRLREPIRASVLRAYLHLFTGARHASTIWLGIGTRERIAVLTLTAMMLLGGLFPQPGVTTRESAAQAILEDRRSRQMDRRADDGIPARPIDATPESPSAMRRHPDLPAH